MRCFHISLSASGATLVSGLRVFRSILPVGVRALPRALFDIRVRQRPCRPLRYQQWASCLRTGFP